MEEQDRDFWKEQFLTYREETDKTFSRLMQMAEKFGKLGAETKSELQKITASLDKPFYRTHGFYRSMIIGAAIAIAAVTAIFSKTCIELKISDFGLSANCKIVEDKK